MLKYHADLDINQHNSISGLPTYLPTYLQLHDTSLGREYVHIVPYGTYYVECCIYDVLSSHLYRLTSDTGFGDYSWYSSQ
jgi:hypothetical protein